MNHPLGPRVAALRKKARLSQEALARACKPALSAGTVRSIEQGVVKSPDLDTLERLAEALGATVDELRGRKAGKRA